MGHFGENMDLLKLSKFKLQLRTLIAEVWQLRVRFLILIIIAHRNSLSHRSFWKTIQERDRTAAEQLHHTVQVFANFLIAFSFL